MFKQVFEPLTKGVEEVWHLRSSMSLHQSGKLPQVTNTSNVRCSIIMSSTHYVDNANQVHIRDEDGIEKEHCLDVHEEELSVHRGGRKGAHRGGRRGQLRRN
jgi:hypothetical protein